MAYTSYATKQDLADYLVVNVSEITTNQERLLIRASELIETAMFKNYVSTNSKHVEAAKKATCAQVEMWMLDGEDKGISQDVASYSLDSLSVQYVQGNSSTSGSQLSKRSLNYLSNAGLLYRGV